MFWKTLFLVLALSATTLSLKCRFEVLVSDAPTYVDIEEGVEKCQNGDNYCAEIKIDGSKAKGCSETASLFVASGNCESAGCNSDKTVCCCEGDMCNGVSRLALVWPFLVIAIAKLLA